MERLVNLLKTHQQKLVLLTGFVLVALISFSLGHFTTQTFSEPVIKVESAFTTPPNYTPNVSGVQSETQQTTTAPATGSLTCDGRIKGASSMIYHVPGDPFYNRTTKPIACFDTEAQAVAAGFRKPAK